MFKLVVVSYVLALASAISVVPLGWNGAGGAGWAGQGLASPLVSPLGGSMVAPSAVAASLLGSYNYRGPLSLAPGQPANILAADGRPLDTLSVNLDRAAHLTARAVDSGHVLRKRSAVLAAGPVAWTHTAGLAVPAHLAAPVVAAPIAAAPLVGPWGLAAGGNGAAWSIA